MDKSSYEKNPVVLYGHDANSLPVGKSLWQKKTVLANGNKAIIAKTKFADTPEGNTVYALWKDGFLNAASIGFLPKTYEPILQENRFIGYDIKEWELLEYSIVPIPANQEALRLHIGELGDNLVVKSLRQQLEKNIDEENRKKEIEELNAKLAELAKLGDSLKEFEARVSALEQKEKSLTKSVAEIVAEKQKQRTEEVIAKMVGRAISDIIKK
jgi:HK97 family phage prohead protease